MNCSALFFAVGLLLALPTATGAQQQRPQQLFYEGNLRLESDDAIKDFSISYVTYGTLNAKK